MVKPQYKYSDITSKIIGAAMAVHKGLGTGFQEIIYQEALKNELIQKGLSFHKEFEMPIFYKEAIVGSRRVDFLVESVVAVEIKAVSKLEAVHTAQAINYLEAFNLEVGLLINFGAKSLEFHRYINSKLDKK